MDRERDVHRGGVPASALVLLLLSGAAPAQLPGAEAQATAVAGLAPPATGGTTAPDAPRAAPPPLADGAAADPSSAAAPDPPRRALLLPVEFTVYQAGVGGGLEAMPDWTEAARANLSRAALHAAKLSIGAELTPLPDLTLDERARLDDHVALARLVVAQASQLSAKAWSARKADFDRSLGDGLHFLREKTGSDYAVLIDGAQVKQSGGSIFIQLALAAAGVMTIGGGGTQVVASVIDLRSGEVKWFNSTGAVEVFGTGGKDVRDATRAQGLLDTLFGPFPFIPALGR